MSQCLRCHKLCPATAVFCDECRSQLRTQLQEGESASWMASIDTSPLVALLSESENVAEAASNVFERVTGPQPVVKAPKTPATPVMLHSNNLVDSTISRLNEAAQRIEEVEQASMANHPNFWRRHPRASRLAPVHDISADIQRESTPLPAPFRAPQSEPGREDPNQTQPIEITSTDHDTHAIPLSEQHTSDADLPDFWPWLDTDTEEGENDKWEGLTDPLQSRHFPNSAEARQIEEEDIQRARAEGLKTASFPTVHSRPSRARFIFLLLAILAIVALVADGILISVALLHSRHNAARSGGPPSLTISPTNQVNIGETINLHINNFTPSTRVLLTHDVELPLQTVAGSPLINLGQNGNAKVSIVIDDSFVAGFHLIEAEDIQTRQTASTMLQIMGQGPTKPSHLFIGNNTLLDLGAGIQGTSTIQSLALENTGGGSISWSVSSNSPWLLVSPTSGIFSQSQKITVAVQRGSLKPGDYTGKLTFASNVDSTQSIKVQMTVRPVPPNVAVLEVTPPVLSFTASDGGSNPVSQTLTVSNPGSKPLPWSLAANTAVSSGAQISLLRALGPKGKWLSTDQTSGVVAPSATSIIHVMVQSRYLLPGVYTQNLQFLSNGAVDNSQIVSVTLTILPGCGLVTSVGGMSFTAVAGQSNLANQALTLSATPNCPATTSWTSTSSVSWLSVTPANGQLKGTASSITSVGVNASGLSPRSQPYTGTITLSILGGQSTQTVLVSLTVQTPPSPTAPIIAASPLNLNFSNTQGQPNPPGQVVTITNNGGTALHWNISVNILVQSWLNTNQLSGNIGPGRTGQVTITIDTSRLTPGTYVGQVVLNGTDPSGGPAGGTPQTITINLTVQPACTLQQPSTSSLGFTTTLGDTAPPSPQALTITGSGSCAWPLNWNAAITSKASWLQLSSASGKISASGQTGTITASANPAQLPAGTYKSRITIAASDSSGSSATGSPQVVNVTLTILQPCALQLSPSSFTFNTAQGAQSPNFTLSESGNCSLPISWNASTDVNWLNLSSTSGTDSGSGSIVNVSFNAANMPPGTYTGHINAKASGADGAAIQGTSPITVTLTVPTTIAGTVIACPDITCASPQPLAGASVSLLSGTTVIATVVADGSGSYTFNNVPLGTYTISATGTDSNGNKYTGTTSALTVSGNLTGVTINAILVV